MKNQTQITRDISIDDLVTLYPFTLHYLSQKGIRCIACGEPLWLTLEDAAREKGFDDTTIDQFIHELRLMAMREENYERRSNRVFNFKKYSPSGDNPSGQV
ncbi:MAG: hypothetical protein NT175_05485 [Bacteroidetes bacterium]|nr:hypothetical protein [Bacteroidota bacterium]